MVLQEMPECKETLPVHVSHSTWPLISTVALYVFSVVGTSRCDVRAACSGATPSSAVVARTFVPPATTLAGTAQRAIPTIALNMCVALARCNKEQDPTKPFQRFASAHRSR